MTKAVPSRTTQIVTAGGILRREAMELVMNPHDVKAFEAADYLKRRVGGKVVALSMGPDAKLVPIMQNLYEIHVEGVDECYVLSDRRMAGADTWATAYTVSLGVKKVVELHVEAVQQLMDMLSGGADPARIEEAASNLYHRNLLPNKVYSTLPPVKDTIVARFVSGVFSRSEALEALEAVKAELMKFIVVAGIKTTDGETGSTGPQVAEALSQAMGTVVPHITYVHELAIDPSTFRVEVERRVGRVIQRLESPLPCVLTISHDYRPSSPPASVKPMVRANNYRGKVRRVVVWNADQIGADPSKIGLAGSPTLVGPGVDIGKPPSQKFVGKTWVFRRPVPELLVDGTRLGPFQVGDIVPQIPEELRRELHSQGVIGPFTLEDLVRELFKVEMYAAKPRF